MATAAVRTRENEFRSFIKDIHIWECGGCKQVLQICRAPPYALHISAKQNISFLKHDTPWHEGKEKLFFIFFILFHGKDLREKRERVRAFFL